MVRKLILSALISTAAVGGLTAATASAQVPVSAERHDRGRFQVLVRHHGHWDVHGTYPDRDDAERAAHRLERQGLDARVGRVR